MNRGPYVLILCAIAACQTTDGQTFELLSYNVAGLPEVLNRAGAATNTPLIAERINGYDIVLVQESWLTPPEEVDGPLRTYHEVLDAGARHPFRSEPAEAPLGTNVQRPDAQIADGLNRFSNFAFDSFVRQTFAACERDCIALKGFSFARTTVAPGAEVDIYNLHLESGRASDEVREAAMMQIAAAVQELSTGRAVIIAGDFNLHYLSDNEAHNTDTGVFEAFWRSTGTEDVCVHLECPEIEIIDRVAFRSGSTVTLTALEWRNDGSLFLDAEGAPLSDHEPIAVRFHASVRQAP